MDSPGCARLKREDKASNRLQVRDKVWAIFTVSRILALEFQSLVIKQYIDCSEGLVLSVLPFPLVAHIVRRYRGTYRIIK